MLLLQVEEQKVALSAEQREVVDLVLAGRNVFFTGCAGKRSLCM